jgi:pilus assembly protein CpaF
MVWALSTGHRGSMSTLHAGGPGEAVSRLETLCMMANDGVPAAAVTRQVRNAIDAVVAVGRLEATVRRQVLGVWRMQSSVTGTHLVPMAAEAAG